MLLLSDNSGFQGLYDKFVVRQTQFITDAYPNPEDINNHSNTPPSKRLMKLLEDNGETYDKVTEGNLIAEDVGIAKMLEKCPRFKAWIEKLVEAIGADSE